MVEFKNYLDRIRPNLNSKLERSVKGDLPDLREILFVPLSPEEKGFFSGSKTNGINNVSISQLYQHLKASDEKAIGEWLQKHTNHLYSSKNSNLNLLRSLASSISLQRIECLQNEDYDYFTELKRQYKFYLKENGCDDLLPAGAAIGDTEVTVNSSTDSSVVFIVEGIHSLGNGNPAGEFSDEDVTTKNISIGKLKSRIRQIKGEDELDDDSLNKWNHPPFLMRLGSHFGNGIFGHAKSFSTCTQAIVDQRRDLDKGVIKTSGYEIVRELLGLDENLQPTGSRRILIDMHQLSAGSRNDLYQSVFRKFNKNISPDHPIPVVFTEAAYSGIDYLAEMMANGRNGIESDTFRVNGFNGSGINLSDEDVLEVFRSRGLISLTLEEAKMGSDIGGLEKIFMNTARARALRMLGRQISAIVSIPFAYHLPMPLRIWDSLNIGNGLMGKCGHLERYRTAFHFMEDDLCEVLSRLKTEEPALFGSHKAEHLVQKILRQNVVDFVVRHY